MKCQFLEALVNRFVVHQIAYSLLLFVILCNLYFILYSPQCHIYIHCNINNFKICDFSGLNMTRRHLYHRILTIGMSSWRAGTKLGNIESNRNSIRCGTNFCQVRTMHSEWIYSRKNPKIAAPVFLNAYNYPERVAVIDNQGAHTYGEILYQAYMLSTKLLEVKSLSFISMYF